MFDILLCSIRNITRKKLRSFLTSLGVAVGIASVVMIGNIAKCGSDTVNDELDSLGLGGITISSSVKLSEMEKKQLSNEHLEVIKKIEYVDEAMEFMTRSVDISLRNLQVNGIAFGIGENANKIISLKNVYGRPINRRDIAQKNNVCMVDQKFCQKFYSRDNILGKEIFLSFGDISGKFEVIGIVKPGGGLLSNIFGNYIPDVIYVPYSSIQSQSKTNKFDQVAVKVKPKMKLSLEEVGKKITDSLKINCPIYDKYISSDISKQRSSLIKLFDTITTVLSTIGGVSLLVSSLSIMVIMLVSVGERTREIGIKKSIGASCSSIMLEFLFEAIAITFLGSIMGILLGNTIFFVGSKIFGFAFTINFDIILLGLLFSLTTGLIFGIYPAYKASKMKPVHALRFF
ncbi:MAG: ABC transporter permease [Oscillospiraceae bacterium]|jgi:putative ABC transport system permease protein|nr:ABC transporter permease [Oscillospiraceae bacterium]